MTTIQINSFGIVHSYLKRLPSVILDMMQIERNLRERRDMAGVYFTELETDEDDTFAWYFTPKHFLPQIDNAITVCYAAKEQNHAFFAQAIEMCRDIAQTQLMEDDPDDREEHKKLNDLYNHFQGPASKLMCPDGDWMAVVNGPMLLEVDTPLLEVCAHLNVAVASSLMLDRFVEEDEP